MRKKHFVAIILALAVLLVGLNLFGQAGKTVVKAPDKIVFQAKTGNVTFNHAKHLEREKGNCKTCHPGIFPQSKAPINYAPGMHKPAEAKKTACAACHVAGGKAFETKGNCNKCHVKA